MALPEIVAGGVVASVLSAGLIALLGTRTQEADQRRRTRELAEDLRRWFRDRDLELRTQLGTLHRQHERSMRHGISQRERREALEFFPEAKGSAEAALVLRRERHVIALAQAKRQALHEYRDESTRKRREFARISDSRGRVHRCWARLRRQPAELAFGLGQTELAILASWRTPAVHLDAPDVVIEVDDPTAADVEPELAEWEGVASIQLPP